MTIGNAIDSALNQTTGSRIEVLVFDDGSTDRTAASVEAFTGRDSRVRLLRGAGNGGVARARNRLIEAATGDWLAFLDADDVFLPDKLETCLRRAIAENLDLVTHDLCYLGAEDRFVGQIRSIDFLQASLVSRQALGSQRFSETLPAGEDSQFFCVLKTKATHQHLSDTLTAIRIRRGSLTDKYWFQKRLIELWHGQHPGSIPPADIAGYEAYYSSLSWLDRMNYLRKWLGQKYGRSAAGAMLAGNRVVVPFYLLGSVMLDPAYILSRALKNR
jgi:glycosyltransferase involved in cell wall biosynthesis